MNDLDKKDLLELANLIKDSIVEIYAIESLEPDTQLILEDISGCADAIIEIVENKPHKIERML
jgi:hypothetical protein